MTSSLKNGRSAPRDAFRRAATVSRALAGPAFALSVSLAMVLPTAFLVGSREAGASEPVQSIPAGQDFGAGLTLGQVADLGEVLADPDRFQGEPVLLRGRISDVCQKKGCWTVLSQGESNVRVNFKDYGFFLPTDCSGETAYVEGVVKVEVVSRRQAAHLAGESKHPEAAQLHTPGKRVGFTASGVRLIRSD
jgi:hypothetical protein